MFESKKQFKITKTIKNLLNVPVMIYGTTAPGHLTFGSLPSGMAFAATDGFSMMSLW